MSERLRRPKLKVMPGHGSRTTRREILRAGLAAAAVPALVRDWPGPSAAEASVPHWNRDAYLAYADALLPLLDDHWRDSDRYYATPDAGQTTTNANLLLVHAVAASCGHRGRSRQDARANALAHRLCESPPWRRGARLRIAPGLPALPAMAGGIDHSYGWQSLMSTRSPQHPVIDAAVVRGLAAAYHARDELGMPAATRALIRDRIRRCAYSTFYCYPEIRLNQINWPIEIYAHAATVLGESHLLRHDTRLQLGRFADHIDHVAPGQRVPYMGPSYRFHYVPQSRDGSRANLDSAEYASLVCGALAFYEQARRAGMKALNARQLGLLRAWVERVLCGYWTHSGYPNWDTGLGFARWHQSKKFPLAQEGLLAIASAPRFQPAPGYGAWAKHLFDRGLEWYARQVQANGGLPPAATFGVSTDTGPGDDHLTAARMAANACRAIQLGLGERAGRTPPPLYAYDPDIGRLAVTTPAYNTAILLDNHRALPYGGADPARLFDAEQHVVAGVGGHGDAAFGATVIDHTTGHVTRSQHARSGGSFAHPKLRLLRAPHGSRLPLHPYPAHAFAGPFDVLDAIAGTRGPTATIVSRHRFHPGHIESSWTVLPGPGRHDPHTVRIAFPSWGKHAQITAILRDGHELVVENRPVDVADVAWFHISGADHGYVVVPLGLPRSARARLLHPHPQSSAPHPGPTLAIELLAHRPLRRCSGRFRYTPAADREDAAAKAELMAAA